MTQFPTSPIAIVFAFLHEHNIFSQKFFCSGFLPQIVNKISEVGSKKKKIWGKFMRNPFWSEVCKVCCFSFISQNLPASPCVSVWGWEDYEEWKLTFSLENRKKTSRQQRPGLINMQMSSPPLSLHPLWCGVCDCVRLLFFRIIPKTENIQMWWRTKTYTHMQRGFEDRMPEVAVGNGFWFSA